jgi:hypothetical protein
MSYNYKGYYSPTNDYEKLDVVLYKNSTNDNQRFFLCITSHTKDNPQEPNFNEDTDYWVVLNSESNFPEKIDQFIPRTNITAEDADSILRFQELMLKSNRTSSEDNELNSLITHLRDKIILPEDWNKFQSALVNMQMFIKTGVEGYINQKQSDFEGYINNKKNEITTAIDAFNTTLSRFSYREEYDGFVQYYKWNTVKYNNEVYMCIKDALGKDPTDTNYWIKIAARGEKGEQGLAGLGLVYRGTYNETNSYKAQDAVNYGGSIYYCKVDAPIGVNPSDQNYWTLFLSKQNIPISSTPPNSPTFGELWLDTNTFNPILKYWNGSSWIRLNPDATQAHSGFMSATDKEKLDGIQSGAEVNQEAFAYAQVKNAMGTVKGNAFLADSKQGYLTFKEGNAIVMTADTANNTIDIAVDPSSFVPASHVGAGGNAHALATTTTAGFMSPVDKDFLQSMSKYRSGYDPELQLYTIVEYKRKDGTRYMRSVLSNKVNGRYTVRTETYYATNGTSIRKTEVYDITYDTEGNPVNEVLR